MLIKSQKLLTNRNCLNFLMFLHGDPVDWEETKVTIERFSLALHFGLEGGFVSKILLFPDKLSFILTC